MGLLFGSATAVSANENVNASAVLYTALATHDDAATGSINYSLSTDSDSGVSIDAATGAVRLAASPNYETQSLYTFTVIATSGDLSVEQTVSLNIVDTIEGTAGADALAGTSGDDVFEGLAGQDSVTYAGNQADYRVEVISGKRVRVTDLAAGDGDDGSDTLTGVEQLIFADATVQIEATYTAAGAEFQVNTHINENQYEPSVTALTDGGFVVTWESYNQDGSGLGIYGQRYAADGTVAGAEFQVNTYTDNVQYEPSVTALTDGGFVVTWQSSGQDGSGYGVYGQRYAADGTAAGAEFQVNTHTSSTQSQPSVTALTEGGFVVTWGSDNQDGSSFGVYGQRYAEGLQVKAGDLISGGDTVDALVGGSGAQVLVGGLGDDVIDGGSGYNTYQVTGTVDGFYWSVNSTGDVKLTDTITDVNNAVDGTNEGVDTLRNIQAIRYLALDGTSTTQVIDDYGNAPDSTNTAIVYGEWVVGRGNFYGDVDFFQLTTEAGQDVILTGRDGSSGGYLKFQHDLTRNPEINPYQTSQVYFGSGSIEPLKMTHDGTQSVSFSSNDLSSSSPMSSRGYGFILRRVVDGTDGDDELVAGSTHEYLRGGLGDDTLMGSQRSDALIGGDGQDTLTGGFGNDQLDGGVGTADVAVFTGKAADYAITWGGSSYTLGLTVFDGVAGRDGIDQLKNVEILRFADGDIVLDAESNTANFNAVRVGEGTLVGSLPITQTSSRVDQDYFQQIFPADITTDTALRITLEQTTTSAVAINGYLSAKFYLQGSNEDLTFTDLEGSETRNEFNLSLDSNTASQTWIVSPSRWGSSTEFLGINQRADVKVSGYAYYNSNNGGASVPIGSLAGYSLRVDRVIFGTANDDTLAGDVLFGYIDARAGNDTVTGSDADEEILGGAGDDTLMGGAGDDTLTDFQGTNILQGGAGNDLIDVSGGESTATIDGGEGTDTVKVDASTDWSNLTLTNVEVLDGSGASLDLSVSDLVAKGFTTVQNLTLRLDPNLASGGTLDVSSLAGDVALRGTNQSDTLTGNAGDNRIDLLSDSQQGAGSGIDTVSAGAGNDTIFWKPVNWDSASRSFSSADPATRTYFIEGSIDGGAGLDTFLLDFSSAQFYHAWGGNTWDQGDGGDWHLDLSQLQLSGIETLSAPGYDASRSWAYPVEFVLSAAQVSGLVATSGLNQVSLVGGGDIDLAQLAAAGVINWRFGDDLEYTVVGSSAAESVALTSGVVTLIAGAGADRITLDGKTVVTDTIDGGAGVDTLTVRGIDVDLSGATLSNIESINVVSQSLAMTDAQWAEYAALVTRVGGATTAFTLALESAMTYTLAADADYVGVSGSSGDDRLIGNAQANVLTGNAGNDVLEGKAGDDRLVSGAGVDELRGGAGNDVLDVSGKAVVSDVLAGGEGEDTLVVSDGQDISGATITGIETLSGSGTVAMTLAQLTAFDAMQGISVQLVGTVEAFTLPNTLVLSSGASIALPGYDAELSGAVGLLGTPSDDFMTGGSGNDRLLGGRGRDYLAGGDGNDTLIGGKGTNTLHGGAGDDTLIVGGSAFSSDHNTYLVGERLDGGAGNDTLTIDFNDRNYNRYTITEALLSNVENLSVVNEGSGSSILLSARSWSMFTSVSIAEGATNYWAWPRLTIEGSGDDISFDAFVSGGHLRELSLNGSFGAIDLSQAPLTDMSQEGRDGASIRAQFETVTLTGGNDTISITGQDYYENGQYMWMADNDYRIEAGDGDDHIKHQAQGSLFATIEGGAGIDTFDVSNAGFIDLTGTTLNNVENLAYGSATIILTAEQFNNWNIDGTGRVYTRVDDVIVGSIDADNYQGSGVGSFRGAGGDDTIENVNTAVFEGNLADYDYTRNGATVTIQHARGTLTEGTDTLNNVLNMRFADTSVVLDDAPNEIWQIINASNSAEQITALSVADYAKAMSGKSDYGDDRDVYASTLVPNSPLVVDMSTLNGSNWGLDFTDVATGESLQFKSLVYGWVYSTYYSYMDPTAKWLPGRNSGNGFEAYQGGEVLVQVEVEGSLIEDYAFTINYLDDYAGDRNTLGEMDPEAGLVRGYVGDIADADWIRTELIAGTKYEFRLQGQSSGLGTLVDPELQLLDDQGRLIEAGLDQVSDIAGTDDAIIFRPTESGSYYLAVSDVADINLGSWTLSQSSLDTIAGNVSTTERIEWSAGNTARVESEINQLTDHDWFRVWLDKGITYSFNMDGPSLGGTLNDPQLSLRSISGRLLSQDDNSGGGSDAEVYFSAPDSGWYFVDAGASGNASKGTYVLRGSSLQDDYANSILTDGLVTLGSQATGLLSYIGDSDWLQVGLSANITYVIDVRGDITSGARLDPIKDPLLIIRDSNGEAVYRADDSNGTLDALAFFTPGEAGAYFIEVRSAFKYDIGAYTIDVALAPEDDHGNVFNNTATTLTLGENFTANASGELGIPGDKDVFVMTLDEGIVYQLNAQGVSSAGGTLTDPYVRIFDSAGQLLDFNNNGGLGTDARFYFVSPATDAYYIEVSSSDTAGMGTYALSVAQRDLPPDDVPNNASTQISLAPGDQFSGTLLTQNDEDWFAITLAAGENYVFRVKASFSGHGSLEDPLLELRDFDGTIIRSVDNMLTSNEPAMGYNPSVSGTYYLVVKAADGQVDTGSYTLMTRAPDDHANNFQDATSLTIDQTISGGIQWNDGSFGVRAFDSVGLATDFDEDWFSFQAIEDQILSLNLSLEDGSLLSRPMVEVIDSQGRTLAFGDGLETDNGLAVASFKIPTSGQYYARVVDGAGATGGYQVSLTVGDASDEDASGAVPLSFSSNGVITQSVSIATIGLAGDTDSFETMLQAGHSYRIETVAVRDGSVAPLPSAALSLSWLADGESVATEIVSGSDALTPSFFDSAAFTALTGGKLSLVVAPLEPTQTGRYQLRLVDLGTESDDDHIDSVGQYNEADHGVVAINETVEGKIDTASDSDLFAVNLTQGNIYDFSVKGYFDGLGTLAEAELRLLNASGQLVSVGAYDDSTGRNDLSLSVFNDGRYFLQVSALDLPGNTGSFTLDTRLRGSVAGGEDDMSADTQSGVSVAPGKPVAGTIEEAGDHDWLRLTLEEGKVYVIDVLADGSGIGGTLPDATLRLLDASGTEQGFDDNSGAGKDAHLQFAPAISGDFYLDVAARFGETGTYTVRVRELYSGVADPLAAAQWYLEQAGILELDGQYSGAGITIGMVDDGVDTAHPDLQANLNFSMAYDTQFDTRDGQHKYPPLIGPRDFHGTLVAGIMMADDNNETGIRGVAPDAELASTRVKWSWDQMIQATSLQWQFDVSNNSWGASQPFGDNFNSTNLTFGWVGLRKGVEDGREGLGTVFVFSAGNSAGSGDNTNYHNFQNAREVLTVGAANDDGTAANFSTPGASVLVSTYGVNMMTTARGSDYTSKFSGTSASAPLVSGVVALMLEANPNLGYRDVQKILAYATTHPEVQDWKANGASDWNLGGLQYNDKAGFGLVDAYAAVRLAETWTATNTSINEASASARKFGLIDAIPDGDGASYRASFEIDSTLSVEHVELGVDLRHSRMGDLVITLTSPDGTVSTLMDRPTVTSENAYGVSGVDSGIPNHLLWDFSSVQFWGEDAAGIWTIEVTDTRAEQTGTVQSLSLRIYGERNSGDDTYIFTDEGFTTQAAGLLEDETGNDTINASSVRFDLYVDLADGIIAANAVTHGIASWSLIEHAVSGSGNDRLVGNDADNRLIAGAGNDTLEGGLGNDFLHGGAGQDTVKFSGAIAEYQISWNPDTEMLTVIDSKTSNGNEGTDSLVGIERLVFDDAEMSLAAMVGNRPPVANSSFFEEDIQMQAGVGIDYQLPEDVFTDADGESSADMEIVVSDAAGGELPEWLSYDPETGTFAGTPPEDYQGTLKLKVEAIDEFGESASDILTLQFGDNQAPIVENPRELVVVEDQGLIPLAFTAPMDPENTDVRVELVEIPSFGAIIDKTGSQVSIGALMSADELTELFYQTAADANGDAGYLRYRATDEDGVSAESSLHIFVDPVNDAPRFTTESSKLVIDYPNEMSVILDVLKPNDIESVITTVRVIELPELGVITLDATALTLDQVLTLDQLERLQFDLAENVNGPIGALGIQAVDEQNAATNWRLELEVQGESGFNLGTAGPDELYGSVGSDTLYGKRGDDLLVGNGGDDTLLGGLGNDQVLGGSGADTLDGSAGNDYLDGGLGADFMLGGPGHDTYIVDQLGDIALEVISGGAGGDDLIVSAIDLTAPDNVENLQAATAAVVDLEGNALDNVLVGNNESNRLSGLRGRDTLLGEGGDDVLDGGQGVDSLAGHTGNDEYHVDSKADRVIEQVNQGEDSVFAESSYTLASNIENLTLLGDGNFTAGGNSLDNVLIGNSGNNILAGGLGSDRLEGGLGDDIYVLSDTADTIIDIGGVDTIRSNLDVVLIGDIENADLVGIGDTMAIGNGLDNALVGNMADNLLEGAGGVDTLTGGQGADTFVMSNNGVDQQADLITDFKAGEDLLVVDLASFGISAEALGLLQSGLVSASSFVAGAGAEALDLNDYFMFDTAQGILQFDSDGSGDAEAVTIARIQLDPDGGTLTAGDVFVGI